MRLPRVTAVLLDIDDTLVDTRGAYGRAVDAVVERWMPHLDAAARAGATRHWATDPLGAFRAYTRGELTFTEQRRRRCDDLHHRFGGPHLDDAGYEQWEAVYENAFRAGWALTPDALALLDALEAAGLPVGSVTNVHGAYQAVKLAAVGLTARLPVVVGVDALGVGKPDPRVWALACDRMGVDPAGTVYVGDELDVDARGARDAGLVGIWLDRHRTGIVPGDVPVVRDLGELPELLGLTPP